ncbi:MAG: cbb3-type cytochrome oxidase assembly protein CcoS [Rubrivivax sp.]
MDILFLLIPLSALLVLIIVAIFGWAVQSGQFDDLEREGQRLLRDHPEALDQGQAASVPASRQFDGAPGKGQED